MEGGTKDDCSSGDNVDHGILALPSDVLLLITKFLDPKSVLAFGCTCKKCLVIVKNDSIWRRRLCKNSRPDINDHLIQLLAVDERNLESGKWFKIYRKANRVLSLGSPPMRRDMAFNQPRGMQRYSSQFNFTDESCYGSIEMWFKTHADKHDGVLLGCQSSAASDPSWPEYHWQVCHVGPDGRIRGSILCYTLLVGPQVDDGQWHHVALTSSPTSQSLFVDGVLADTAPTDRIPEGRTHQRHMCLAQVGTGCISYGPLTPYDEQAKPRNYMGYYPFYGHLRELRLWHSCLTAAEVASRCNIHRVDIYLENNDADGLRDLRCYWPLSAMFSGNWPWQLSIHGAGELSRNVRPSDNDNWFEFMPI